MHKSMYVLALVAILVSACGTRQPAAQSTQPPAAVIAPTETTAPRPTTAPSPTALPPSATPLPSSTPESTLFPIVSFSGHVVCHLGPDVNYYPVISFDKGQTAQAEGRSEDSAWVMVPTQTPNKSPSCWVPATSLENPAIVSDLLVAVTPALPVGPSRATASKSICGNHGASTIQIYWYPAVNGLGYYVYRNGKNVATVYDDHYLEFDTPNSKTPYVYAYTIQAFDASGLSKVTASVSVTLCD